MIKILDKAQVGTDTFVVQKVVKPDGTFLRYQVGIPGHSESFTEHKELVGLLLHLISISTRRFHSS